MTLGWGGIARLCLANAAIGGMAALPVNLFNRLMTVELALPALLPGVLVALHYAVQLSRPVWGHRSDARGGRTPFILGGTLVVGAGLVLTAWGIAFAPSTQVAIAVWIVAYALIGFGIGAAGTSFLALLATAAPDEKKGAAATFAWLMLIAGAIAASVGAGIALKPYSPERLMMVVPIVAAACFVAALIATWGVERRLGAVPAPQEPTLGPALRATWADPAAKAFTGFVFLSILAFYLSELVLEPFAGHIHGLTPDESTKLSGGKDGAALLGMLMAGAFSTFRLGSLRTWAVTGCVVSAVGLMGLGAGAALVPFTVILGLGNGLFVVGAIGSMMRLAAAQEGATGTRMGVFGAAQAVAAGLAGLIATGTLDVARSFMSDGAAYAAVFGLEAVLFLAAALVAVRILHRPCAPLLQPGE
ncbi:BCD family MFS transporter [Roseovarius atlanticus]|uniref:BCD family MFS transporter n=1 Tax=Roseovarius atlanticus TaxID=1641875 RepID=UPI001C95C2C4|nr:BCD family MFS transporter [Roseovarius atlanticus]MBY5990490.1 BCD family MFS transporter [Roseovarius atlanticus]MBY6127036.1 BCD family MFS transporter [Roseovarius atlanticus]MBY6151529.1 BCD family MFS transporter [Roseovarius atlanticus]